MSLDRTDGAKEETVDTQCDGGNWINYITGLFWFCLFLLPVFCVVVVWQNLPTLWQHESLITKIQSSSPRFWQQITHYGSLLCTKRKVKLKLKHHVIMTRLPFALPQKWNVFFWEPSNTHKVSRTERFGPGRRRFSRTLRLAPPSFPHFWLLSQNFGEIGGRYRKATRAPRRK